MELFPACRRAPALDAFFSMFPAALAVWDLDGRICRTNACFERLLGYSSAEMEGRSIFDFAHPEDRAAATAEFRKGIAAGEAAGFESRARCKDGSYRWFVWSLSIPGGDERVYVGAHDITERKLADERARRSDEWLRFTLDTAGIGLCQRESGETSASEQQFRLYGLEPAETWITHEHWLQLIHPDDRERIEAERRLALEQSEPYDMQFRVVWPDGSIHWLLCRGRNFCDSRGARKAEVTIDVTARKRAEADLEEFFNMCRAPIAVIGFDGHAKRVNAAVVRASGVTAEELTQHPVTDFFHPDDRAAMQAQFQKLSTQGGEAEFECRGLGKDGSPVWFVFSATAVPDERSIFTVAYDITERKRAEEALQFRNVLLSTQQEASIDGILVVDEKARILSYNRRFVEMWGLPKKLVDEGIDGPVLQSVMSLVKDPPLFLQKVNYLYEHRQETSRDELMLADGRVFDRYSAPMFGPEERYYGRVWHFRDITERKRAEVSLRESEEKFRELFDCAPVGYQELDLNGTVRRVNRAECTLLGHTADEMLGRPVWEFVAAAEREDSRELFRRKLSGQQPLVPYHRRYICRDGAELWIEVHDSLVRDAAGEVVGIRSALQDVTRRKRAEDALRESEENFRELFDHAPVAYHELDMNGITRRVNLAECTLLGYTASEILDRPVWEFLAEGDRDAGRQSLLRKLSGEEPASSVQRRFLRRDGAELWVEIYNCLVCNAAGETVGIRAAMLDITERKRMAEDLKAQAENLARSNTELERFAYVASHDLQEPLRMVASFTQLLARRYNGRLDEKADEYIHYAVDGAKRMQELINDLLAYSRVNTKDLELQPTDCEVVVCAALGNLKAAISESGAVVECGSPLPVVKADALQLGQLFQNLVGNAIKFHGPEPPRIRITAAGDGAYWLFSVRDNGIGIDPRHADRIFQIFQRLHGRSEYPGTGIGLAVCQKVVERHGGRIWVESQPGAGADFRFTLPKSQMES